MLGIGLKDYEGRILHDGHEKCVDMIWGYIGSLFFSFKRNLVAYL